MKHDKSMKHDSPINEAVYKSIILISSHEFMLTHGTVNFYFFPSHYLGFKSSINIRELGRL